MEPYKPSNDLHVAPAAHFHDKLSSDSIHSQRDYETAPLRPNPYNNSQTKEKAARLVLFLILLTFLVIGRYNVPNNDIPCVKDKVLDWLQDMNNFVLNNPGWRDALQILCSAFMDLTFLVTGGNWIMRGNSGRIVIATLSFYIVRAIVQSIWFSPYPPGYWWEDPGFPSIVVPYGKGSDFFYSGHIGFVTICAMEWKKNKNPLMFGIIGVGGAYTAFILLVYRIHYSIDVFTGITFAHYMFIIVDHYKDSIDSFFKRIYYAGRRFFNSNMMDEQKFYKCSELESY